MKTTAYTSQVLILPISVIIFILIVFVYIALLMLAFSSMKHSMKVNFSEIQERRLKKVVCAFIDGLFWIPAFIVSCWIILGSIISTWIVGCRISGTSSIDYILYHLSVILYAVMQFSTIYYFRDYTFSRKGLYRDFSPLEIQRQVLVLLLVALQVKNLYIVPLSYFIFIGPSMGVVDSHAWYNSGFDANPIPE